uniref:Uncharacterized protein n=1 Tax=Bursaphelenchus xylophilus TaxID=6326 RepID=A0A1I7SP03_BURXY
MNQPPEQAQRFIFVPKIQKCSQSVVPSGCLRRDYCPGLPLRPKTQPLQLAKALGTHPE